MDQAATADDAEAPAGAGRAVPHLLHVFPSYTYGGVPIRIAGIINRLGPRYRHTIFALDGNLAAGSRLDPALGVRLADPGIGKPGLATTLRLIRRRLRTDRPDLLLTYNWGAIEWTLAATIFGLVPAIHFESGFGPDEADRQLPRRVWMRRIALARARALVVPSHTLIAIARTVWHIPPRKIRHIPNGVDCALFGGPGDPSAVPGFVRQPGETLLGTVAPLRAEKNLGRMLRAFARLQARQRTRLLIAGDGPERPALEALARSLGIAGRVIFAGHVERPEQVYPLLDVFVMSSETEQMPNTLIQAMAASRAVASVDVGDVKAILAPENQPLVVSREDEAGLAASLDRLIADEALRAALGAANRRHVLAHYSLERMVAAYAALYDSALPPARRTVTAGPT